MIVQRNLVVGALTELADAAYQERVWTGHDPSEMSSFVECIETLFDDSGLNAALTHGSVYETSADEQLRTLGTLVESVDAGQPVDRLLQDAALANCRHLAASILRHLLAAEDRGSDE